MKKIIILFIVPFLIFGQDLTYVPDDNFEQRLIDLFFDDGCVNIFESLQSKNLVTTIDILGKLNSNHKGFQLEIYDDGSIEKKYLIK